PQEVRLPVGADVVRIASRLDLLGVLLGQLLGVLGGELRRSVLAALHVGRLGRLLVLPGRGGGERHGVAGRVLTGGWQAHVRVVAHFFASFLVNFAPALVSVALMIVPRTTEASSVKPSR